MTFIRSCLTIQIFKKLNLNYNASAPPCNTGAKLTKNLECLPSGVASQLGYQPKSDSELQISPPRANHPKLMGELLIDGLVFNCPNRAWLRECRAWLEKFFGVPFDRVGGGKKHYTQSRGNIYGTWIMFSYKGETNSTHFTVEMKGGQLTGLTQVQIWQLMRYFNSIGCHCTRVDPAVDIYQKIPSFSIRKLYELAKKGDVMGVRKYRTPAPCAIGEDTKETIELGSRKSNYFLRVYDKAKENDTCKLLASLGFHVTWIRIELEIKGSAANNFVNCLLMAEDDDFEAQSDILAQLTLGSLAKTVDFGKRSASGHRSRFKRFKFWQTILDGVARLDLRDPRQKPSFEKMKGYVYKQVGPTLATIISSMSWEEWEEWFYKEVIVNGLERLNTHQKMVIQKQQRIMGLYPE